jgi:hypothetical protein
MVHSGERFSKFVGGGTACNRGGRKFGNNAGSQGFETGKCHITIENATMSISGD